ncbi:MAG: SprT family zinc-dependent metalloprotease [Patescibacteria group bacterium]|nr:SprT family zinc-dependent metalloprotease [Patescibacteria group bacterium]
MKRLCFKYGRLRFEYELMRRERKTMGLTVRPDSSIVVKCPLEIEQKDVDAFLRRKWAWLNRQLNFFERGRKIRLVQEYVSGESFLYLGRQYMLKVKRGRVEGVKLNPGRILLFTNQSVRDGQHNRQMLSRWYRKRAVIIFAERLQVGADRFKLKQLPDLHIKKMNRRWGSYLRGKVILNPALIRASKDCIDYVIAHELCHTQHKRHDKPFYNSLDRMYPGWQKVKEKLELRFG